MTSTKIHVALMVLIASGIAVLGFIRVHDRHQVIRVGYELSDAQNKLRELKEEQSRLRLEESFLASPERIESLALSLGMIRPTPDQLRVVRSQKSVALGQAKKKSGVDE